MGGAKDTVLVAGLGVLVSFFGSGALGGFCVGGVVTARTSSSVTRTTSPSSRSTTMSALIRANWARAKKLKEKTIKKTISFEKDLLLSIVTLANDC